MDNPFKSQPRRPGAGRPDAARASRLRSAVGHLSPAATKAEAQEFEHGLRAITQYAGQHGGTYLRDGYIDETGFPLAVWVAAQREAHLERRLAAVRRAALEQVPGWRWAPGGGAHDGSGRWRA